MWEVTHGYLPSQEALMQFVMSGGTAGPADLGGRPNSEPGWSEPGWAGTYPERVGNQPWQGGRGRGRFSRGGGFGYRYGNPRERDQWGYDQGTDAVILAEEGPSASNGQTSMLGDSIQGQLVSQEVATTVGAGGRMQRVGDKWVFVRDAPSGVV
jgi:protein NRD1